MTFKSRRKRLTTVLLALTAITAVDSVRAQDETPAAKEDSRELRLARRRVRPDLTMPAPLPPTTPVSARTAAATRQDELTVSRIQIDTEPPTPERLFQLRTAVQVVERKELEIRKLWPNQAFVTPGPSDDFDNPNSDRLGRLWSESVRMARGFPDWNDSADSMGVVEKMGQYPRLPKANVPPAVAVMNEYIPSSDMSVAVNVDLGSGDNEFGVMVRAKSAEIDPPENTPDGTIVTYYRTGEFYAATLTANRVVLRLMRKGKATEIAAANVAPKTAFRLTVQALGSSIRVLRDDEQILTAQDSTLLGHYAGVAGLKSGQAPVKFDNFEAKSYAGDYQARLYAATLKHYRGPNVHHGPLYFEQRGLERYGHHLGNLTQPFVAHGLFFTDVAFWPISVARTPPWECQCSDLWARPGDCVPFHVTCPPVTRNGVGLELGLLAAILLVAP